MERYASHKVAMGGVVVLVLLLLVLLLVPTIKANGDPEPFIGIKAYPTNECYFAVSSTLGTIYDAEVFVVEKPGSPYDNDVVSLLKCQADLDQGVDPPATIYFGSSEGQCQIDVDNGIKASTSWWSQTTSASGKVTLTCQFKSNNGNN